jgi:hypothetical protein
MPEPEATSAEAEHRHHRYVGNRIPWYVHLLWVLFWTFAVLYVVRYLFPDLQREMRDFLKREPPPAQRSPA